MAYSDYGAFVYKNGERRTDKEDVGVFDNDEAVYPSCLRIFANIQKRRKTGNNDWFNHSQHRVLGDGSIRVACYKQGFPLIYRWNEGVDKPEEFDIEYVSSLIGKEIDYFDDYDVQFSIDGYHFKFVSNELSNSRHYEAEMIEPDGTHWKCIYDYRYGAGITD